MEKIRITGRSSRLSLLQMEKAKLKIEAAFPDFEVVLSPRDSRGDLLQHIPLQTVEGSDFFTQDIFNELENGEADIAIHSLKDMSSDHFFGQNKFGVFNRDDIRDVAIFNKNVEDKIKQGASIIIGTCSPRREEMAIVFLQKALPQWNDSFKVVTKTIRGNVDSRLRKLEQGEYDGIILATAGINRLLDSPYDAKEINQLLSEKRFMLLPLIECVPAPCQGAIVAEAHHSNHLAVKVVNAINDKQLFQQCSSEKKVASTYGKGCLQRFGVATIAYATNKTVTYAAGKNQEGEVFSHWVGLPKVDLSNEIIFSATNFMGSFFSYEYEDKEVNIIQPNVFIANYKAVKKVTLIDQLRKKNIWVAGTKTWYELAKQKIWVTGSADAFGLAFLQKSWGMPLFNISKENVCIITGNSSISNWQQKGWNAIGTYSSSIKPNDIVEKQIGLSTAFFWTSYHQYNHYKHLIKRSALHCCPSGETAILLKEAGINPIIFPNIKSFLQWKG